MLWAYVIESRNGEEIVEPFMKSNCKLQIKQNLIRLKKVIKRKGYKNSMSNRKTMIISLRVGLIKKI